MAKVRLFLMGESSLFVVPSEKYAVRKMRQRISNIDNGLSALKVEMSAAKVRFAPKWVNNARNFQPAFARMWKSAFGSYQTLLLGNSVK